MTKQKINAETSAANRQVPTPKDVIVGEGLDERKRADRALTNIGDYSAEFRTLVEYLLENEAQGKLGIDKKKYPDTHFIQEYEYDVNIWPIIIDGSLVKKFNSIIDRLHTLIRRALKYYFDSDTQVAANYLQMPEVILELFRDFSVDSRDIVARHDLLFSQGTIKLLEINAGSTIGGWQHDAINTIVKSNIGEHEICSGSELRYRFITEAFFSSLANSIKRLDDKIANGNILFFGADKGILGRYREQLDDTFASVVKVHWPKGMVFDTDDPDDIEVDDLGRVYFGEHEIDAVLLVPPPEYKIPKKLYFDLTSAYLKGKIVFPDSPFHIVYGNKLLFALLHEPALRESFGEVDVSFIEKHIPWSSKLTKKTVIWEGEESEIHTFLKNHRQELVLKKTDSFQGRDVIIGHSVTDSDWGKQVDLLIGNEEWIVQQFCSTDELLASHPDKGMTYTHFIWGIFQFEDRYAGSFVRGLSTESDHSVINSANGAQEFIVFESCNKKRLLL